MRRKNAILDHWCTEVGRDPAQIERSTAVNQPPENIAEGLLQAGITLFIVGMSGPSYDLTLVRRWIAWRNDRHSA
jgi:hypothetical protein